MNCQPWDKRRPKTIIDRGLITTIDASLVAALDNGETIQWLVPQIFEVSPSTAYLPQSIYTQYRPATVLEFGAILAKIRVRLAPEVA